MFTVLVGQVVLVKAVCCDVCNTKRNGLLTCHRKPNEKRMTPLRPPTEKEAFKGQLSAAVETIESDLEENGLDKYLESAEALLEKYSATDLAALLLKQ